MRTVAGQRLFGTPSATDNSSHATPAISSSTMFGNKRPNNGHNSGHGLRVPNSVRLSESSSSESANTPPAKRRPTLNLSPVGSPEVEEDWLSPTDQQLLKMLPEAIVQAGERESAHTSDDRSSDRTTRSWTSTPPPKTPSAKSSSTASSVILSLKTPSKTPSGTSSSDRNTSSSGSQSSKTPQGRSSSTPSVSSGEKITASTSSRSSTSQHSNSPILERVHQPQDQEPDPNQLQVYLLTQKNLIKLPRLMLVNASAWFRQELQDHTTSVLDMRRFKWRAVEAMVEYLTTGGVQELNAMSSELLPIANQLQLKQLKAACEDNLMQQLNESNCVDMLKMAHRVDSRRLKDKCIDFINANRRRISEDKLIPLIKNLPKLFLEVYMRNKK